MKSIKITFFFFKLNPPEDSPDKYTQTTAILNEQIY